MTKFGKNIRIETYVSEDLYTIINKERQAKNTSLSGFVASILKSVFREDDPKGEIPSVI